MFESKLFKNNSFFQKKHFQNLDKRDSLFSLNEEKDVR
jgi:hypothetical protein